VAQAWYDATVAVLARPDLDPGARDAFRGVQERLGAVCERDPFEALFAALVCQASALYGERWRPAALQLAHSESHPRPGATLGDPYPVTANLKWPGLPSGSWPGPADTTTEAQVRLTLVPAEFGPAEYAALPLLFTHELVSHVAARQDKVRNLSSFAEGLLDWAAHYFLELWADKVDGGLAGAARAHAEQLKELLVRGQQDAHDRRAGHLAARQLQSWFHRERLDCDPKVCVAHLAVQLNLADRPLHVKENFVSAASALPMPPPVESALRRWAAHALTAEELLDAAPSPPAPPVAPREAGSGTTSSGRHP